MGTFRIPFSVLLSITSKYCSSRCTFTFFQGQEFGNPGAVIEQHEDNLVIFIILLGPDPVNLFPGKFVPAVFVRVPVFVLRAIHVGGLLFVAVFIL